METTTLSDQFAVRGQITSEDLAEIKSLGFKSLICVRPDGEAVDQPSFAEIDQSARALGLFAKYIPVQPSGATPGNHAAFADAMADMPGPVLGYCRSGQRAAKLWQALQDAAA